MTTIVYIKTESHCVQCDLTLREMDKLGIPYRTMSAEENLQMLKELNMTSAPVVVPDNMDGWAGFQPELIKQLAAKLESDMIETVRERVGFEQDLPDNGWFWDWYMNLEPEKVKQVDNILDNLITYTRDYLKEKK